MYVRCACADADPIIMSSSSLWPLIVCGVVNHSNWRVFTVGHIKVCCTDPVLCSGAKTEVLRRVRPAAEMLLFFNSLHLKIGSLHIRCIEGIFVTSVGFSKFLGVSGETSVVTELPLSFGLLQYWKGGSWREEWTIIDGEWEGKQKEDGNKDY